MAQLRLRSRRAVSSGIGDPPYAKWPFRSRFLGVDLLMFCCRWKEAHMGSLMVVFILSLSGLALGMTTFMSVRGVRAYWRARGKRLVTCPETHCAAAVELDAKGAGLKAFRGGIYHCLQDCSRWPERQGCAQDCLVQVEALGQRCLVRSVVAE